MQEGKLGTLAEGAYADLLIVEGNPFDRSRRHDEPSEEPQAHHEGWRRLQERVACVTQPGMVCCKERFSRAAASLVSDPAAMRSDSAEKIMTAV